MWKITAILAYVAILAGVSAGASGQTSAPSSGPVPVTACDLEDQPSKFDGKLVRVRARAWIEFENFTLYDPQCRKPSREAPKASVWLEYGGDESTPAIYCCGDHSREQGQVLDHNGQRILLLRDAQLAEFRKRLTAARDYRPDGRTCYGRECYFYDVSATITGHFFSRNETEGGGWSGYGHLGMHHLLFIEKVSEVEALRTSTPAGGIFTCKKQAWEVPEPQSKEILAGYDECDTSGSCKNALRNIVDFGARHWQESRNVYQEWREAQFDEAERSWSSPDLLTTLDFIFPDINPNIDRVRTGFTITRTRCSVTKNPLPPTAKVHCESEEREMPNPEETAARAQRSVDRGFAVWRLDAQEVAWEAVQSLARERKVVLPQTLESKGCRVDSIEPADYGSCEWSTPDRLQVVSASVVRYASLVTLERPKDRTAWVTLAVNLSNCNAD